MSGTFPEPAEDVDLDFALASCAAQAAMERHSGRLKPFGALRDSISSNTGKT